MENASRESKHLQLHNAIESLSDQITKLSELQSKIREGGIKIQCGEETPVDKRPAPSLLDVMLGAPDRINKLSEDVKKATSDIKEMLF